MPAPTPDIKILFLCTGVGIMNRGIESFFREAFDGLYGTPGLDIHLLRGGPGPDHPAEHRGFCFPRTRTTAKVLGKLINRTPYVVEQLSLIPSAIRLIRKHRFDVVYYSDTNIMMRLHPWRSRYGAHFKGLYSNGAPISPPFGDIDLVQQVVPQYLEEALAYGEPPSRHVLVPYGIIVPDGDPPLDHGDRAAIRTRLKLPQDRPVVLSVGWIAEEHKRMHHVIREIASMPGPRPFLQLLGNVDVKSPPIFKLAAELLGEGNYAINSVPYEQVADYYRSADIFTLCSLKEGFGRVYLEALLHGLPAIAHRQSVMQYVLGEEGTYVDMSQPGELAASLGQQLAQPLTATDMARRRNSVRTRFGWPALQSQYRQMFRIAAGVIPHPG